jgi:hypothetical protein
VRRLTAALQGVSGDQAVKAGTVAAVLAVAAFAAIVSYSHIYDLAREHGQSGTAARLLPLSVDGLIVAASLAMLQAARTAAPVWLARCMLALGVGATVGANVLYGLGFGVLGAVISAWPAVAFIGSAELAIGMVRHGAARPVPAVSAAGDGVPAHLLEAQETFAGELAAGRLPTIRAIRSALGVGQPKATEARAHLEALART